MDPRHKLYKELDKLTFDPDTKMSDDLDTGSANSGVTMEDLKRKLVEGLGATHVEIEDLSGGCGQMYEAIIVSPQFTKKATLARHRLVNTTLKAEIAAIHAWTPKCYTPEQWEEKRPKN